MIKSMTAFSRVDVETESGSVCWEVRSVNSRYLESHFKLPDGYREIESALRDIQKKYLKRGKVETLLRFKPPEAQADKLAVNLSLVTELNQAANQINRILDNPAHISALDIMQWPGVLQAEDLDMDRLKADLQSSYTQAIEKLVDVRAGEGASLAPLFDEKLGQVDAIVSTVRKLMPEILAAQKAQLIDRLSDVVAELDPNRLEQEMVIAAQKADVAEELDRLNAHTEEVRRILRMKEPVGRRLDFLMQELNREANTLSSKSIVVNTTNAAVELKVIIEQMREQVQNIE